jgi:hypothetical protein
LKVKYALAYYSMALVMVVKRFLAWPPGTEVLAINKKNSTLKVTNALAFNNMELVTAVKRFFSHS